MNFAISCFLFASDNIRSYLSQSHAFMIDTDSRHRYQTVRHGHGSRRERTLRCSTHAEKQEENLFPWLKRALRWSTIVTNIKRGNVPTRSECLRLDPATPPPRPLPPIVPHHGHRHLCRGQRWPRLMPLLSRFQRDYAPWLERFSL